MGTYEDPDRVPGCIHCNRPLRPIVAIEIGADGSTVTPERATHYCNQCNNRTLYYIIKPTISEYIELEDRNNVVFNSMLNRMTTHNNI